MAYDHELADRIRELLSGVDGVREKRMFGGLAFLVHGNMAVAASSEGGLLVRVEPDEGERLLGEGVQPMVMRGREMRGWLRVDAAVVGTGPRLREWVTRGVSYAAELPAKD
ncbi:TfoX/Sxy family protein [Amycolatopsis thermoflava]|uniref:TfoX/Sxy family protein n=1 Tax=Amycolatopsis thermoflava TaxID=84480 RepID=UPI003EB8731E